MTLQEITGFEVLDDTHGVFRIASQMATGGRVTIAIEDIQRDGMTSTAVTVECSRGKNTRAASPARAGSIRQFAQNIDSHGQSALQGESFYDQRRAATPPRGN